MARAHEDVEPSAAEAAVTVAAVRRWLDLGRDVVVRGDEGSGRSRVLRTVLSDASRRGITSVLLRAAGDAPLSALRGHASVLAERVPPTPSGLAGWLAGELRGRRAVLLVDDLDLLDAASTEVVLQALRLTSASCVATTSTDLTSAGTDVLAALVSERAPAEVRLRPLGFRATARLLAEVLRAPADVALTSSITARSGGNARVAIALADAARFAGAAQESAGRWHKTGSLDDVPLDAVAHALLARLGPEQVEALELLAWTGPLPEPAALSALGAELLEGLVARGRVRRQHLAGGATVTVAPPALAAALRARLAPERRHDLSERVAARVGPDAPHFPDGRVRVADMLLDGDRTEYRQWAADLAGVLNERTSAQEAARRAAWQTAPTVAHANAYLDTLLLRRADAQVATVFQGTEPAGSDALDDVVTFRLRELRWAAGRGESDADLLRRARAHPDQLGVVQALVAMRRAEPDDAAALRVDLPPSTVARAWGSVVRAAGLLDAGRPDLALGVCEAEEPGEPLREVDHHLDGLHAEALLLLGRLEDAALESRRRLEQALDDLDLLGIRAHACLLAEALLLQGESDAAWRVLGTSLRIGPGGPMDSTFFRRGLTVGAVLLAQRGATDVAGVLLEELEATPPVDRPVLPALEPLGRAALAEARDPGSGGDFLWDAGSRYAEDRQPLAALVCWLAHPGPYDAERLQVVRDTFAACRVPLLEPYLRLHEARAAGDQDAVVAALASATVDIAGLVRTAVASLDPEHAALDVVWALDPRLRPVREEPRQEALSPRERDVAALAGAGLTNRQIADRLQLSVRTVENHMSAVLGKLGVSGRGDLTRWFPPVPGPLPATQSHPQRH
ncbi:helix-turn-helix transcriptional regulator [Cellulomonas endometrii]|uniref:helix-turn-helix transcriptional regulator n=1 Tax=Cellulomonas endometrii TaxID=3036301 RepID=UPI0024AE415E|nr:helix-turn-helix transcriptional regulator [Cellulomonas endometrii]